MVLFEVIVVRTQRYKAGGGRVVAVARDGGEEFFKKNALRTVRVREQSGSGSPDLPCQPGRPKKRN